MNGNSTTDIGRIDALTTGDVTKPKRAKKREATKAKTIAVKVQTGELTPNQARAIATPLEIAIDTAGEKIDAAIAAHPPMVLTSTGRRQLTAVELTALHELTADMIFTRVGPFEEFKDRCEAILNFEIPLWLYAIGVIAAFVAGVVWS